ncbi:MAG: SH3 domain-containing protein [Pseudomonadota bacterium]
MLLAALITVLVWPALGAAERLSVASPVANIRSGPGTAYDVLWQIEQYHPLIVIERSGPWIRFRDYQGDTGYIHNSLVGSMETVITADDKCNVRSGPGTQFPVVFSVGDGVPFKVLEHRHNWLRIEHADGDGGWIYRSLVW